MDLSPQIAVPHRPLRIVSGGQTGVDRAALEVALALGWPHGGWCPKHRLAEDGTIPSRYELTEMPTADYAARTEQNVCDSDGTLILLLGTPQGGTELTRRLARRYGKPCQLVDLDKPPENAVILAWLADARIETLNVAGPRESSWPGIEALAFAYLLQLLKELPVL